MKKMASILLALYLFFAVSVPALALSNEQPTAETNSVIVINAEETQWYYRVYNGERQKRLWSITNGYWLTDWMPYNS